MPYSSLSIPPAISTKGVEYVKTPDGVCVIVLFWVRVSTGIGIGLFAMVVRMHNVDAAQCLSGAVSRAADFPLADEHTLNSLISGTCIITL